MQQLLLFEESPSEKITREIKAFKDKYDNLRKSQHARISGLQKKIDELELRLNLLEANICKGNVATNLIPKKDTQCVKGDWDLF
jgi:hypothetical protein